MNAQEYYAIWINQQSTEFINSKYWSVEQVTQFAQDFKDQKFLNGEVLAEEKSCDTCKLHTPLGNRLCAMCYPPDFHYWGKQCLD